MRIWLAQKIHPPMCTASRGIVMSYRGPDTVGPDGEIVPGVTVAQHRACGKRPGHAGEHGPWGRWFRWRTIIANKLDP